MRRSFKLKFFLLLTCLIVFFAIVTRVSVRHASSKPIHELLYANFASYLELSLAGESALAHQQNLKVLEQQVLAFYGGLKPRKQRLSTQDASRRSLAKHSEPRSQPECSIGAGEPWRTEVGSLQIKLACQRSLCGHSRTCVWNEIRRRHGCPWTYR